MSYNTHNFKTGDVLKASDLNQMDDEIKNSSDSIQNVESNIQTMSQSIAQQKSDIVALQTNDTAQDESIETLDSTKVGYSEVVGSQLLMYTDSTKAKLLATLDLPSAPVQDVQVAGTSVLSDGVAVIPKAATNTYGAVRMRTDWSGYGISQASTGDLCIAEPTTTEINGRSTQYKPITPHTLNAAVKAALTDSNRDTTYTDEEKANACGVIGAERAKGDWVLKGTLTEAGAVNVDLTGCTELYIIGNYTATGSTYLYTNVTRLIYSAFATNYKMIYAKWKDTEIGFDSVICKESISQNQNNLSDNISSDCYVGGNKHIADITYLNFGNKSVISACEIKIYAR